MKQKTVDLVLNNDDILTEIEKELKVIAEYDDQLQMLDKYFVYKDPLKVIVNANIHF